MPSCGGHGRGMSYLHIWDLAFPTGHSSCGGYISYTIKEKQNIQVTDFKYKQELEKKELKCLPIGDSLN